MRLSVVGVSCSGKSTLARKVAEKLGIEYIEQDNYFWKKGWEIAPEDEFKSIMENKISVESWTTCGNHSAKRDLILSRATHVIWLNYPKRIIAKRAFVRTIRRVFLKEPCCNGNRETFRQAFFSTNSILWWILKTYKKRKNQYRKEIKIYKDSNIKYLEFKHPKEVDIWLSQLALPSGKTATFGHKKSPVKTGPS